MKKISNVTIGTDPELFIYDSFQNKVISSIGIIPGEKGRAFKPKGFKKGFGLQIDNILAEFNIPPVTSKEEFVNNICKMKDYIDKFVKTINPNYTILCKASYRVDEDQLQSPEAKLFGCCPDYNVYTERVNEAPQGECTNLRTTGTHIHVGYNNPDIETSLTLIRMMDVFLGIPSVVLDTDVDRRSLYGKAGCFRITPYGFEYRTLSGYFISSTSLMEFLYDQTMKCIESYNKGDFSVLSLDHNLVQDIINKGDTNKAKEIIKKYNLM